ncbi:MAG: hypothetical protein WA160_02770 [Pseudobdellovibrio sp.]
MKPSNVNAFDDVTQPIKTNKTNRTPNGFSLIELTTSTGIALIAALILISIGGVVLTQGKKVERSFALQFEQQLLYTSLNERNDIKEMLKHIDNKTSAFTNCIFVGGTPCLVSDGANSDGWKIFKGFKVNRTNIGDVIYPLAPLPTAFDPFTPNTDGFNNYGTKCNSFDATTGNDDCPFRYSLWWKPSCAADCTLPKTVLIEARLEYKPSPASTKTPLNPANFTLHFAISIEPPVGNMLAGTAQTTCLILDESSVKCWGNNDLGSLGQNFTGPFLPAPYHFPHEMGPDYVKGFDGVSKLLGVVKLTDAHGTFCALMSDKRVTCWGDNTWGQVGIGKMGPQQSGTGKALYFYPEGYVKATDGTDLSDIEDVFGGDNSTCAQKTDGRIFCWGQIHEAADVCTADFTVPEYTHSIQTYAPAWGWLLDTTFPQVTTVTYPFWTDATLPAIRVDSGMPLVYPYATEMTDVSVANATGPGKMYDSTTRKYGASGCSKPVSFVKYFKGRDIQCFLESSPGKAICWGSNIKGQLGATAAAGNYLLMNKNYYLPAIGLMNTSLIASDATAMTDIIDLELGNPSTPCALFSSGNAACWGAAGGNVAFDPGIHFGRGYLGNGVSVALIPDDVDTNVAYHFNPPGYIIDSTGIPGSKLSGIKKLSAGGGNVCAIKINGEVYCWGANSYGGIGNPALDMDIDLDIGTPTKVLLPEPAVQVRVLDFHSCALTASHKVYCWGLNSCGQLGYIPSQVALGVTDYALARWSLPRRNTPVEGGGL